MMAHSPQSSGLKWDIWYSSHLSLKPRPAPKGDDQTPGSWYRINITDYTMSTLRPIGKEIVACWKYDNTLREYCVDYDICWKSWTDRSRGR